MGSSLVRHLCIKAIPGYLQADKWSDDSNIMEIAMIDERRVKHQNEVAAEILIHDMEKLQKGIMVGNNVWVGDIACLVADSPQRAAMAGTACGGLAPCHMCEAQG
ncbi:hypothetical protein ADUPG1_008864, partial [Aduncisulcus paluster]